METLSTAQLQRAVCASAKGMVSTPVLNQGSASSDGKLEDQEKVDEVAGSNFRWSEAQLEQLLWGRSSRFEPVSMTTLLV